MIADEDLSSSVHDAISSYLQQHGCLLDAWCGWVEFIGPDGERNWLQLYPANQFFDRTMAMVDSNYQLQRRIQQLNFDEVLRRCTDDE